MGDLTQDGTLAVSSPPPYDDTFALLLNDFCCSYCCKKLTHDTTTELTVPRYSSQYCQGGYFDPPRSNEVTQLPDVMGAIRRPKVTFHDGRTFEGQWKGNVRHGDGKECSRSGDFSYQGQFRNDVYHGFGTMKWSNGSKYIGNFQDNQKHGWGHEFYQNGESYKGYFNNGKVEGHGMYYFKDGTSISGEWRDGRLNTNSHRN